MFIGEVMSNLFEVLTKGNPKAAVPVVEHLTGHQSVKDSGAGQWYTEVKAKQPPILRIAVELKGDHEEKCMKKL